MRRHSIAIWLALGISAFGALGLGCAGKDINEEDPAELMKDAEGDIESDRYQLALDKLRVVKNKHPYSKYAVDAQLRIADVYFLQESFSEAASSYEAFRDLHPKHEKVAYAMYRTGLSYFNDIPGNHARDLTPATKALEAFQDFLKRFPASSDSEDAKKKLQESREILAEKELYIANYYFRQEEYLAAQGRYEKLIANYSDTHFVDDAKKRLAEIEKLKAAHP